MGFVSISAVLAMMLLYQSFYGVVYHRVALVNALYMLGLAAGSHAATRRHVPLRAAYGAIILVLGMMLVYTTFRNEALFWALILALSALCGTVFPSLFKLLAGVDPHRAASMLDSMDHFGAIVGSLLTVMTLIPFLGLYGTLIAALAVAFCAFIFIGAAGRGKRGSS
jgi:CDP-diglyceride synthetase